MDKRTERDVGIEIRNSMKKSKGGGRGTFNSAEHGTIEP